MEFAEIYHKISEQMSYPLDEDQLVINLKTGYDGKHMFIHHGAPSALVDQANKKNIQSDRGDLTLPFRSSKRLLRSHR